MRSAVKAYQQTRRDQLILENLEFVQHAIHKLLARLPEGVDLENLQQAGVYGLIEAAEHFDPSQGTRFRSFAWPRITGAVIDELRRNSPLPQEMHRKIGLVQSALERLPAPVGVDAIAEHTGLTQDQVEAALEARRLSAGTPFDEEMIPGVDSSPEEPDAVALRNEKKELLARGIQALPEQQRIVLTMYYLDDLRLKEIGAVISLSESRVSRILSKAELALREYIRSKE